MIKASKKEIYNDGEASLENDGKPVGTSYSKRSVSIPSMKAPVVSVKTKVKVNLDDEKEDKDDMGEESLENDGKPIGPAYSKRGVMPTTKVTTKTIPKPVYVKRTSVTTKSAKAPPKK